MGQAAKKTKEIMDKAIGKVLFIDEAYGLNPRHGGGGASYMQEVSMHSIIPWMIYKPPTANITLRVDSKYTHDGDMFHYQSASFSPFYSEYLPTLWHRYHHFFHIIPPTPPTALPSVPPPPS